MIFRFASFQRHAIFLSTLPTRLTFLGTSTSVGVPVIGCDCQVCTSNDPRNRRTRSSIFLETDEVRILVDTGPDLREQALREKLTVVDHVLYTHDHVDHIVGFDEIRAFCLRIRELKIDRLIVLVSGNSKAMRLLEGIPLARA